MHPPNAPSLPRSARFCLSSTGRTTEAAYRSGVARARGPDRRALFESERSQWALAHRLEPDDGVYLVELVLRPLTLAQLGEGLAICSQTRDMVKRAVERLVERGYVVAATAAEARTRAR